MNDRITRLFHDFRTQHAGALLPYLSVGYPSLRVTRELILRADQCGVAAIELGFPFSDSIADGPVIQSSFHHALANAFRVRDAFRLVREVRADVGCALVAMLSYTLVHRMGLDHFMDQAAGVGLDGMILPDVPIEESDHIHQAIESRGLAHVGLVAPTTSPERRQRIVRGATGFIYQIAAAGTTGERAQLPDRLAHEVSELRRESNLPVCVGFGISNPNQVREVCRLADGAVVGSALIRRMGDALKSGAGEEAVVEECSLFIQELMTGTVRTA